MPARPAGEWVKAWAAAWVKAADKAWAAAWVKAADKAWAAAWDVAWAVEAAVCRSLTAPGTRTPLNKTPPKSKKTRLPKQTGPMAQEQA